MIGRTNGGSGGGLPPSSAILRVLAFVGATITISKDGVSKTLNSSKAHVLDSDETAAVYIFSIGVSQFGTWTVTETDSNGTLTKTITIDAAEEYEVLMYRLDLLIDGQAQSSLGSLYQYSGTSGTWQITDEYVYLWGSAVDKTIILSGTNGFDITKFSKFRVEARTNLTTATTLYTCFGLQTTRSTNRNSCFVFKNKITTPKQWYEFDISNNTGTAYLFLESVGMPNEMLYVYNIELA